MHLRVICLEFKLVRDCVVQTIPEAQSLPLKAGGLITVVRALGHSVTVETSQGLARLHMSDLDVLGSEAIELYAETLAIHKGHISTMPSEPLLWELLKCCYDPEIPVNIVDLGLVYDIKLEEDPKHASSYIVWVKLTLSNPGSAMGPILAEDIKHTLKRFEKISTIDVDFVWDPVWSAAMISVAAKQLLGL